MISVLLLSLVVGVVSDGGKSNRNVDGLVKGKEKVAVEDWGVQSQRAYAKSSRLTRESGNVRIEKYKDVSENVQRCFNSSSKCNNVRVTNADECKLACAAEGNEYSVFDNGMVQNGSYTEFTACYCCGNPRFYCCNPKWTYEEDVEDLGCKAAEKPHLSKGGKRAIRAVLVIMLLSTVAVFSSYLFKCGLFGSNKGPQWQVLQTSMKELRYGTDGGGNTISA
eukprot:gene60-18186_t